MDPDERAAFGEFIELEKRSENPGSKNDKGDFTYQELRRLVGIFRQERRAAGGNAKDLPTGEQDPSTESNGPDEHPSEPLEDPARSPFTAEAAFDEVIRRRPGPLREEPWSLLMPEDFEMAGFEKEGSDVRGQTRKVLILRVVRGPYRGRQVRLSVAWDEATGTFQDIHEASGAG
jgi:hypothetical protein